MSNEGICLLMHYWPLVAIGGVGVINIPLKQRLSGNTVICKLFL